MADSQKPTNRGALSGIRVLDLTSVIMGPFASHILADMGADVIKIESPEGDSFRKYRPSRHENMYGSILNLHRNKRSALLNLKDPLGRQALDRLIASSDVLLHNFRPEAAARLALDWERVRQTNARLVLCSARGFGQDGPYGHKAAYDDLIQAGSGLSSLYTQVSGVPQYYPTALCDKITGQTIASAILAALLYRERGGSGQEIEVPMFETAIEWTLIEHFGPGIFEPPLGPIGFPRQLARGRKPYRTRDGWACILPYSDRNWLDFFGFVGRPELGAEPRYATIAGRLEHIEELYALVDASAPLHSTAEWESFCDASNIPCMPVCSIQDILADAHVRAVGLVQPQQHPSEGRYHSVRPPAIFSETPYELRCHAPTVGQHTEAILQEAGLSAAEIARLTGAPAASPSDTARVV